MRVQEVAQNLRMALEHMGITKLQDQKFIIGIAAVPRTLATIWNLDPAETRLAGRVVVDVRISRVNRAVYCHRCMM